MLYLNPPLYVIEGVSLFPDHADPAQYYYLPLAPHLTTRRDPVTGVDMPQLQLIEYRGDRGNGGFLNFDVNLGLAPDVDLDELTSKLAGELRKRGIDVKPHLAPIPVVDGTVKLLLLGAQTPDPNAPKPPAGAAPPAPSTGFVVKMQSAGKPSLYGEEDATFSVQLDQDGTTIVEAALKGELSPIGVVYSLDFLALRPSYSVKVSIDWNRVQKHLDESFTVNVLFFSSDVNKVIDQLVENQAIHIEDDSFFDENDPNNKDLSARRDMALAQARDLVKSTFFQSSISPPTAGQPDDIDKATRVANTLSQLATTGGMSSTASFGYKKVDITRIDKKALNATFEERTTVRQTIFPQGHLGGLFRAAGGGLPLDKFIVKVDTKNPYFDNRTIEVISRADFDHDQIQSIDVRLEYGGVPQTALLEPGPDKGRATVHWGSLLTPAGAMLREVKYSYRVTFKGADRSQRPVALDTQALGIALSTTEDKLEISPRDILYAIADVPIGAMVGFPWDRYPQVDVLCRYTDDENQIHQEQNFRLSATAAAGNFQMFLRDPAKRQFDYRITYHGTTADLVWPWKSPDDEQVLVHDPFPRRLVLTVVPQVDWATVDRVFVDLTYEPDDSEASFEFNAKDNGSKTFTCNPTDPTQKLVAYSVAILTKAGATLQIPKSYTSQRRLIVRPDMRGHRVVGVAPAQKPFAGAHVTGIDVDLRYTDAANGLSFSDRFSFKSPADQASFEYDYVDEQKTHYDYKLTTRFDNGLASETDWASANASTLTISVG